MNREQASKLWQIIKAYGEGATVQYNNDGSWSEDSGVGANIGFDYMKPEMYRLKPQLKPWTQEYLLANCPLWVRAKVGVNCCKISVAYPDTVRINLFSYSYSDMLEYFECTYDGVNWEPCCIKN